MGRLYDLRAWHKCRRLQLGREPLCRMCAARGKIVPAEHVDHIVRISEGGDWFEESNLQSLCHSCHSLKTKAEEGATVRMGCGADGVPVDAAHHWSRG